MNNAFDEELATKRAKIEKYLEKKKQSGANSTELERLRKRKKTFAQYIN